MRAYLCSPLAIAVLVLSPAAVAKDKAPPPPPQAYQELIKCKELADPQARLACFDAQVGRIEAASKAGDLVITDRATVRETRKGLFGFKLPSLGLFGGGDGDDDKDEIKEITSTVQSARKFGYGSWRLVLADGSAWEQVDAEQLVFDPVSGNKVRIYKGALGTYRMNIDGQRAIKVRRVE
jgi:hypothetical protein